VAFDVVAGWDCRTIAGDGGVPNFSEQSARNDLDDFGAHSQRHFAQPFI